MPIDDADDRSVDHSIDDRSLPVHRSDDHANAQDEIVGYVTGDPHFPEDSRGGPWAHVKGVGGDATFALCQTVTLCLRAHCDLYLPGDIFDGPDPSPEALADVYDELRPLIDSNLKIYYVLGNHDRERDWLRALGPRAVRLDGQVVENRLGTVSGMSFVHPDSFAEEIGHQPATDVGLYHQTWTELVRHGRTSLKQLPRHHLAICGDIHQQHIAALDVGPRTVLSPGTLTPQSVTEFQPTVVYGITPTYKIVPVTLHTRKFIYVDVKDREALDRLIGGLMNIKHDPELPYGIHRPFVSVRLHPHVGGPKEVEAILAAAKSSDTIVRVDETRSPRDKAVVDSRVVALGSIDDAIEVRPISNEAKALCRAILSSPDPEEPLMTRRLTIEAGVNLERNLSKLD